jgi:transposase
VYNKTLDSIKRRGKQDKISFNTLRDKHVTQKNNPNIQPWELQTPKDVRAGAVKDAVDRFFTLVQMIKERKLTRFNMKFRTKKQDYSIVIPKKTIQATKDGIQIFKRKFDFPLLRLSSRQKKKTFPIESDCRLQCCRNKWFLYVPIRVSLKEPSGGAQRACSCDPGVRKFQTVYSEKEIFSVTVNKEIKQKLLLRIDHLRSLRARKCLRNKMGKKIKKAKLVRYEKSCHDRYHNLVSEMHNQLSNYLTHKYKVIILPHFESQKMVQGKNLRRSTKRLMLQDRHYQFRTCLERKCAERKRVLIRRVALGTEEYTSKTCGWCGIINTTLGSSEVFHCTSCSFKTDRDVNGARNIMIERKRITIMERTS